MKIDNAKIQLILLGLVTSLLACPVAYAAEGIVTDGTVGPPSRILSAPNATTTVVIQQSDGTTIGQNLFHSFSKFNVESGQTVKFTENTTNALNNVISRVTGGSISEINGHLESTPGGHADFYLINPAGVVFGQNAQIDVPAAFHVSTADELKLQDGGNYSASQPSASTLSAAAPAAFGFLGKSSTNNALIDIKGSQLSVKNGQTVDLVGGDISVENGALITAPTGEIRLVAIQGLNEVNVERGADGTLSHPAAMPTLSNAGFIKVDKAALITAGSGGGRIGLWGGNTSLSNNGAVASINTGTTHAKLGQGVNLKSTDLQISNGGQIASSANSSGNAGKLTVKTGTLRINGEKANSPGKNTGIISFANSIGRGADVEVDSNGVLEIFNGGEISSSSGGLGHSGNLKVEVDSINISGPALNPFVVTGIYSTTFGSSNSSNRDNQAGTINVLSHGALNIFNGGEIMNATFGTGNGGQMTINSDTLTIDGQGNTFTGVFSRASRGSIGNVDAININTTGALTILDGGHITSSTSGAGNAGNIIAKVGSLKIDGQKANMDGEQTGIFANAFKGNISSGKSGDVYINSKGSIDIIEGGEINLGNAGPLDGGNLTIKTATLTIDGKGRFNNDSPTGILANAFSTGNAGTINVVSTGALNIFNTGRISTSTFESGSAGNIDINSATVNIDGDGAFVATGILSRANPGSTGNAGTVQVTSSGNMNLINGGDISCITFSSGKAGALQVKAARLLLDNADIAAEATSGSSGKTGNVAISASESIQLFNQSTVSIENDATSPEPDRIIPGDLHISAPKIYLNNSEITSKSTGNVAAGNIFVHFNNSLFLDPSYITTEANNGNGGSISVEGGQLIQLLNSGFKTTVHGSSGNGGNINVASDILVMETGLIQANTAAKDASGGNITLNLKALIPSGNTLIIGGTNPIDWQPGIFGLNVIQAAAPSGLSGNIQSSAPRLNLSGELANFGSPQFDSSVISQDYCSLGSGSSLTRSGKGGLLSKGSDWYVY